MAGAGVSSLPIGVTERPLTYDDIDAIVAMVNDCERNDSGEAMLERADLVADTRVDGFDVDRDWIGTFDGPTLVAWAFLEPGRRVLVDVHPDARGRGIGAWLRAWTEERRRAVGSDRVAQTIDDVRTDAIALLARAGYTPRHTTWILRMEHPERPAPPAPPAGIDLRAFEEEDEDEVLAMFETAFSEFDDRLPTPPSVWRATVTRREGFVPDDLVIAVAEDRIVGAAFLIDADEIWVDKLAVDRAYRDRGIARALLQTAFVRSFDRGYRWTSLSTDSRTGALTLYERVGMTIHRSYTSYALNL
jgi:GNAT superfamily N-acetyltransferase